MKTVYRTIPDLIHTWFNSDTSEWYGRASSVYAENNKLFSYGNHYTLAQKIPDKGVVLINEYKYSNSTSKHQNWVRRAIPSNLKSIYVLDLDLNYHYLIEETCLRIQSYLNKIPKARTRKEEYLGTANYWRRQLLDYLLVLELSIPEKYKELLTEEYTLENYEPNLEKYREKQANIELKRQQKEEQQRLIGLENLSKWLNFEISYPTYYVGITKMRFNESTQEIETTQYMKIHKDKVKKLYLAVKNGLNIVGQKVDDRFTVLKKDTETITIGCHVLLLKDIIDLGDKIYE